MTEKLKSNRALLLLIEYKTEDCLFSLNTLRKNKVQRTCERPQI